MTKRSDAPAIRFKGFSDAWEQRKLGEIGSVSMCRRIFKEQTSETGDIPFYKIGTFGAEPDAFISRELFEEYKSKYPYPKKGDILFPHLAVSAEPLNLPGIMSIFRIQISCGLATMKDSQIRF